MLFHACVEIWLLTLERIGQALSLEVEEVLYDGRSKFQEILVFKSRTFGKCLVLDGCIQCTQRDEYCYQEMIANLPLMAHPNPKRVLIVGGGDGGVLREVIKHDCVEHVDLVDIDGDVIEVSKKFLPEMAESYSSPKATVYVADGFQFLKDHKATYDVIITDSSDPDGPAVSLFDKNYYQLVHDALNEGGMTCSQGECMFLDADFIANMVGFCKEVFPHVNYATGYVPTYPTGQMGYLCCAKGDRNATTPARAMPENVGKTLNYYNEDIHKAAFVLPQFLRRLLRLDQ